MAMLNNQMVYIRTFIIRKHVICGLFKPDNVFKAGCASPEDRWLCVDPKRGICGWNQINGNYWRTH